MTNQKPIEPLLSHELAQQWSDEWWDQRYESPIGELLFVATQAARWGADQELTACINWLLLNGWGQAINGLRAARRPKPKSQAEEALEALDDAMIGGHIITTSTAAPTIRAALERLRELEGNQ